MPLNPLKYPAQWNYFKVGGTPSPGVCKVGKAKRAFEWEEKRGKGVQGATLTYQGVKLARWPITVYLWRTPGITGPVDPDDFALWDQFVPLLKYDPTKKTAQAIDFYYPSISDELGITAIVCESLGNVTPTAEGSTKYEVDLEFIQYLPAPAVNVTTTPTGATSNPKPPSGEPAPVSADVSAQELLQQLQAQAQSPT